MCVKAVTALLPTRKSVTEHSLWITTPDSLCYLNQIIIASFPYVLSVTISLVM